MEVAPPPCLYCGEPAVSVSKGEHVIPKCLGGSVTIQNVCNDCNNTVLSRLDEALVTRSVLASTAAEALGSKIGLTWGVIPWEDNLLFEAELLRSEQSMRIWPQLILEGEQIQSWSDREDEEWAGPGRTGSAMIRLLKNAYDKWNYFEPCREFRLECVQEQSDRMEGFRYPPRIFARDRVWNFSRKTCFHLSYLTEDDRRRLLRAISKLDRCFTFNTQVKIQGSRNPIVATDWFPDIIRRSVQKIALNLLCKAFGGRFVNHRTFPEATNFVLYDRPLTHEFVAQSGFIRPHDLESMKQTDDGHAFRLLNYNCFWRCFFSFFGGKIAAVATFPGPSCEGVRTVNFSMPLRSSKWEEVKYSVLQETQWRITDDPRLMNPSLELTRVRGCYVGRPKSKTPMKKRN